MFDQQHMGGRDRVNKCNPATCTRCGRSERHLMFTPPPPFVPRPTVHCGGIHGTRPRSPWGNDRPHASHNISGKVIP